MPTIEFDFHISTTHEGIPKNKDTFQLSGIHLADQIIGKLVTMITNGVLKPGYKLPPEPELMKQFGAWRTPIREAVGALALIGLIKVHPSHFTDVAVYLKHEQTSRSGS